MKLSSAGNGAEASRVLGEGILESQNLPPAADLLAEVIRTTQELLRHGVEPAVRLRLLHGVLRLSADDPEIRAAEASLEAIPAVLELIHTQHPDGGWGRFHSRDSRQKRRVLTTEWAVERALALGLPPSSPMLRKAVAYLRALLTWQLPFPDPAENNTRWALGSRLFVSATLARLRPNDPLLTKERQFWREVVVNTFPDGVHDPRSEQRALTALAGLSGAPGYLSPFGRYQLTLLAGEKGGLPHDVLSAWLGWLWTRPQGVGYLGVRLKAPPPPRVVDRWLASHELLAGGYPVWGTFAGQVLGWLWSQRGPDGRWDLGSRTGESPYLPLCDTWRKPGCRAVDWTARVLALLRAGVETNNQT
jgi:hypothetical protein